VYVPRKSGSPHGVRATSWALAAVEATAAAAAAASSHLIPLIE
jgi:hypothetical protein